MLKDEAVWLRSAHTTHRVAGSESTMAQGACSPLVKYRSDMEKHFYWPYGVILLLTRGYHVIRLSGYNNIQGGRQTERQGDRKGASFIVRS